MAEGGLVEYLPVFAEIRGIVSRLRLPTLWQQHAYGEEDYEEVEERKVEEEEELQG